MKKSKPNFLNNMSSDIITNAHNRDLFNKYIVEINKYKPLTRDEEYELFKDISETKNQIAIDKVCKHNLKFVISVAKKYAIYINNSTLTLEDLVNEGNIGLIVAADRFDYKSGNKFISYAVWWIRQYITALLQKNVKTIRLPLHVKTDVNKILNKQRQLQQKELGEVSTIEAFEALMEEGALNEYYDIPTVSNMLNINNFEASLNTTVGENNDGELIDLIKSNDCNPYDELVANQRKELALNILNSLPDNMREYFIDYFGFFGRKQLKVVEMSKKYGKLNETIRIGIKKQLRKLAIENRHKEIHF